MTIANREQTPTADETSSRRKPLRFDFNPIFRSGILAATSNPLISRAVQRYGMRLGAARFVAGETFDEAIPVLRGLNQKGMRANTALLGEGVKDPETTRAVVAEYKTDLDRIATEGLQVNIALKLTHLGLDLDPEMAYRNVSEVVAHAARHNNFIRIDMEESNRVDDTLRIYRRLRADGHNNVGTVLQSYLYRTPDDLEGLLPLVPNLRLVKGAYLEPANLAYPRKADVDRAYITLAERMLTAGGFTAIATHDERIIDHVIDFTRRHGIGNDRFEFQMLFGVRPQYQSELARAGHRVLIATPYGPNWYLFLMRRLAERPANLVWFASNLIRR
ncbi:MAG: proline dehydrogenase family protein [Chloroflexota bacterium]|nr:proline dehydrogenase family protein [Chloroflexia bacterium]MDQ3227303.1 proline dehydrogenase family protein [Chloroflexota bacterium]